MILIFVGRSSSGGLLVIDRDECRVSSVDVFKRM